MATTDATENRIPAEVTNNEATTVAEAPPEVTTMQIYRGVIPFIIIQAIGLLLIILFPELVTWLL